MTSCRTAAGCPSCRLAADGLPSRRGERREDAPCARKSESDVHVPLPQAGHRSEPISKHPSQSRQRASRRSGRCKCGARDRNPLIIDVSPLDVGIRRVNSRQVRSSPQSERDLRAAAARPEARIARPWTGARHTALPSPRPPVKRHGLTGVLPAGLRSKSDTGIRCAERSVTSALRSRSEPGEFLPEQISLEPTLLGQANSTPCAPGSPAAQNLRPPPP